MRADQGKDESSGACPAVLRAARGKDNAGRATVGSAGRHPGFRPEEKPGGSGVAYFGRLAPYLERLFLRLATPCVSSTPRTMW